VDDLETRELRYFLTVAEELHFGRAAARLGMSQPPLSRAVRQLEQRIGVDLFVREPRGVRLTTAGAVLVGEARSALAAVAAAGRRTRRAGLPTRHLVLAVKAGADHELLQALLDVHGADPDGLPIEVLFGEVHEQAEFLRDGRADVALMHRTYDDLTGFDTEDLRTEDQVAILPRTHPLAARESLVQADLRDLPDLPAARWPRPDGSYPDPRSGRRPSSPSSSPSAAR
jgi:DNA-binding transcriptional LysR family regulator